MTLKFAVLAVPAAIALTFATPAQADELYGGLYVHDIESPLTLGGDEDGVDFQFGWRSNPIKFLKLQQHFFVALSTSGHTHYAAWGISRKFGERFFIRPGVGIAVHTGSAAKHDDPTNDKVELGSRFLFEPELGIGARISDRLDIEASWVHLSHAQLFGGENPGMDNVGVRLTYKLR